VWSWRKLETEIHPIDILVDLVTSEKMDPWDIDIEDIANKFLEKIRQMAKINLRLSGKTLLTSSLLLRMKSDNILPPENGNGWDDEWSEGIEELGWVSNVALQQSETLPELSFPLRRLNGKKCSLFELVDALQKALGEEMLRKNFPKIVKTKRKMKFQVDEEDITVKIGKLYEKLKSMAKLEDPIKFSSLIGDGTKEDIVRVLLPLLHLDSQRKIKIWQKELFGEIFISMR
jgi:segregation and condensation protein A